LSDPAIALFIYRRPKHLANTLRSLGPPEVLGDMPVFVFGDGARHAGELDAVAQARAVARSHFGARAQYIFNAENRGLANSVINGVNYVLASHDRVIVLEDDLELAPSFLPFMTSALDHYAASPRVMQISGYCFDVPEFANQNATLMLPIISTWGWATWRRAWRFFDEGMGGAQDVLASRELRSRFNFGGSYDYASLLEAQRAGLLDSWGIQWYLSVFREDGLAVFPPRTLVRNRGMDGSGAHGRGIFRRFRSDERSFFAGKIEFSDAEISQHEIRLAQRALWKQNGGMIGRGVDIAKSLVRRGRSSL
jgi:hypothetical protein